MSQINPDELRKLADVDDSHFGHVTILKSATHADFYVLWKQEEKLTPEKLHLYSSQLAQRRTISHGNLLSLLDFTVNTSANKIDVYFEYSPLKSSMLKFGNIDVAFKWLLDVLSALSYLNGLGFVHGDIRPEFIVYFPNQKRFKIVDKFANFTHPSAALRSYVKTGQDIFASPRFFNEVCNKKLKDAKFNFYKNESFSVGMVLLRILYGPAVRLAEIYSHKFKIFNTFHFLEALKGFEARAGTPKERALLQFLRTKLLCFNEGERLAPPKALEELRELVDLLYGAQSLDGVDLTQVLLRKEHKSLLINYPGLRVTPEPQLSALNRAGEEIPEILEGTDQSNSNSSGDQSDQSRSYRKPNIQIDLDEHDNPAPSTSKKTATPNERATHTPTPVDNDGAPPKTTAARLTARVLTDLAYFRRNPSANSNTALPGHPKKLPGARSPLALTAPENRFEPGRQTASLASLLSAKRGAQPRKDAPKTSISLKPQDGAETNRARQNPSDLSAPVLRSGEQLSGNLPGCALRAQKPGCSVAQARATVEKKDYEVFINFTVLAPDEHYPSTARVLPSVPIRSTDAFSLRIDDNLLKINFREDDAVREEVYHLDEVARKGLSLHLSSRDSTRKPQNAPDRRLVNMSSIEKIPDKGAEQPMCSPQVLRKYVRTDDSTTVDKSESLRLVRGPTLLGSRPEISRPVLSSTELYKPSSVRVVHSSQSIPSYTPTPFTPSQGRPTLNTSHVRVVQPETTTDAYNVPTRRPADRVANIPSLLFVNAIDPDTEKANLTRVVGGPRPAPKQFTKFSFANEPANPELFATHGPSPGYSRASLNGDSRPHFSSFFGKRVF